MDIPVTHIVNNPDRIYSGRHLLQPGETIRTNCRRCGHPTPHVFQPQGWPPLECQDCKTEKGETK